MDLKLKFEILKRFGTQSQFARKCNKSDNWISRIVTGRQSPSKKDIELIRKVLSSKIVANKKKTVKGYNYGK